MLKSILGLTSISSWLRKYIQVCNILLSPITVQMLCDDYIIIFMAAKPCRTTNTVGVVGLSLFILQNNAYWGMATISLWLFSPVTLQILCGTASLSLWLLSSFTLQMHIGNCNSILMAAQPCNSANTLLELHHYLYSCSILSHYEYILEV